MKEVKTICGHSLDCIGLCTYNTITILLFVFLAIFFIKKKTLRTAINHLMSCAIFVFIAGIILYGIGFWYEGTAGNAMAVFFRSVMASMEMFVSGSELIEVRRECKEDLLYMLMFSSTHFLAICISAAFIIHIMGIRLLSYLKMRTTWKKQTKDLYIFFDLSQESIALAKDIYKTNKLDNQFQIIFVKRPMEEGHVERFSFSHILSFAGNKNEAIEELMDIDALLTYSHGNVTIGTNKRKWSDIAGLNNLCRYINKCIGKKYYFCLSPNEDNNINTAVVLNNYYPNDTVFCKANLNSITDCFANPNLKFINSANLAIMDLKSNVAYQPVSFVKPDTKKGVATKPFRSIIVGFGETGLEVFRFLYEFSSFVGKDAEENPFYCDIFDPKAKELENSLYLHSPALEEKDKEKVHTITFHSGTIDSNRIIIEELIKTVDYIVVCTDNDNTNLSTGINLINLAYKYRSIPNKLTVFIGINDNQEYVKAQNIAKYYNECGQLDGDGNMFDFTMIPFGANKQIFTYKNIVSGEVLNNAKLFFYEYQKTATLLDTSYERKPPVSPQQEWQDREMDKKKNTTGVSGLYYKNELQQKESQDIANSWHIKTKLYLAGIYNGYTCQKNRHSQLLECISTVMQNLLTRMKEARNNQERFTKTHEFIMEQIALYEQKNNITLGEYQTLFENLAKCEHLRWNASNRLLGYRFAKGKHYLRKTHTCMVTNDELVDNEMLRDTIKYDYNTILVSMKTTNI